MEATTDLTKSALYRLMPEALQEPVYQVVDTRTGQVMSRHTNKRAAHARCDRLDLQYGAVRYAVRAA